MSYLRSSIIVLQGFLLADCAGMQLTQNQLSASLAPSDTVATTVGSADLSARAAAPIDDRTTRSGDVPAPMLFPGTDPDAAVPSPSDQGQRTASAEPVALRGDGVEMNFDGTD